MLSTDGNNWLPGATRLDMIYDVIITRVNHKVLDMLTQIISGALIPLPIVFFMGLLSENIVVLALAGLAIFLVALFFICIGVLDTRATHLKRAAWSMSTNLAMRALLLPTVRRNRRALWEHRRNVEAFFASHTYDSVEYAVASREARETELSKREQVYDRARHFAIEVFGSAQSMFDEQLYELKRVLHDQELRHLGELLDERRQWRLEGEVLARRASRDVEHLEAMLQEVVRQ